MKRILLAIVLALFSIQLAPAKSVLTLAWDPSTSANVSGYYLHFGESSGNHTWKLNVGRATSFTLALGTPGDWFFAVSAYDTSSIEGPKSVEIIDLVSLNESVSVSNVTATTAQIAWRTVVPTTASITYSLVGGTPKTAIPDRTPCTDHVARLFSLISGRQYDYTVKSTDANGFTSESSGSFVTK